MNQVMNDRENDAFDEKVKEFDRKVIHYLFTIFFSMITAMITTIALAKLIGW